jgi:hypothetical protein
MVLSLHPQPLLDFAGHAADVLVNPGRYVEAARQGGAP